MAKGKVMIRLTNLADKHDANPNLPANETRKINVTEVASGLWMSANYPESYEGVSCKITEMSLTGNMPFEEM